MKILVTSGDHLLQGSGAATPARRHPQHQNEIGLNSGPCYYGLVKLYFELDKPNVVHQ